MGIGNPAADRSVKQYLANVREKQLKARVVLCRAEPFLVGDLATISEFIHARIRECPSSEPSKIYILARDQAVLKSLFFCSRSDCFIAVCRLIMSLAEKLSSKLNFTFALEASLLGQMFIFRTISQPRTLSAAKKKKTLKGIKALEK